MGSELRKLRSLARAWGGDIVGVTKRAWDEIRSQGLSDRVVQFYAAPFTDRKLGIHWPSRRIVYQGEVMWFEVIHEMGHVFATNTPPDNSSEVGFFGWEYALVRHIGADLKVWEDSNSKYGIGSTDTRDGKWTDEFGGLSAEERKKYLEDCVKEGQASGIIDADGRPICLRRELDLDKVLRNIVRTRDNYRELARKAQEVCPRNGNEFERRCEVEGAAEGYAAAVEHVAELLHSMAVFPWRW